MTDLNLTPLLKGTVDLLILRSLRQGPAHGYEISRWVADRTDGVLTVEDAALYQALHRLEDDGWIYLLSSPSLCCFSRWRSWRRTCRRHGRVASIHSSRFDTISVGW